MTNEQVDKIAQAIGRIASGNSSPDGLEAVAIALAGFGLNSPVGVAISELAAAVQDLADAVRETGVGSKGEPQ